MSVSKIAMRLFGRLFRGKSYPGLQKSLRRARMPASADIYKATSMFYSIFVGVAGGIVGFLVSLLFGLSFPFMLVPILLMGVLFAVLSYQLFIYYPAMTASERGRKIDAAVPYASTFMYALSRSGANVAVILKELSKRPDMAELSEEAKVFLRDTEYLGRDPLTALRSLARTTPSKRFSEFLGVLISIIETGGDITSYFASKSVEYQTIMREEQKKRITTLEFMGEIYVILIAFSPLLFLSILVFMKLLQPVADELLMLIAYVWIPLGSIVFAVVVSMQSRARVGGKLPGLRPLEAYSDVRVSRGGAKDRKLIKQIRGGAGRARLRSAIGHPFKALVGRPEYVLLLSIPAGLTYLLFIEGIVSASSLFWTWVIAAIPYAIAYEFRSRVIEKTEEALPDLLKSLSSASHSGLTLSRSIAVASASELGPLSEEVKRTHRDIQWGASANEALAGMEYRISACDTAARATTLIRKASEAQEDVSDVIDIVKDDVETERSLKRTRRGSMFIYKLIILIVFVVFLITIYFMVKSLMAMPPTTEMGGGAAAAGIRMGELDTSLLKQLFYHILLIEGVFAGVLAAQMGEGDLRGGIKYSLIMTFIAWVIFEYVLLPMQPRVPTPAEEESIMMLGALI